MPTPNLNEEDVKTVLAWGSISYAFGFVIVLLHTSKLGFPLLDLLSARYIWIGLPLTIIAFFARQIVRTLAGHTRDIATELRESWDHLKRNPHDAPAIDRLANAVVNTLPLSRFYEVRLTQRLVKTRKIQQGVQAAPDRLLRLAGALLLGYHAFNRLMNVVVLVAVILGALIFYVWVGYPLVPQSLGGGRPDSVQLIVSTNKAHAVFAALGVAAPPTTDSEKTLMTPRVDLHYVTSDAFYLKAAETRISLSKDSVSGVIWSR